MYIHHSEKDKTHMTIGTIQKWGNSQGIRLPRYILDAAQLHTDDAVEIDVQEGQIVIRKQTQPKKTIEELFAGFEGTYTEPEWDWGEPTGEEIW